jgi:SAM-dependent methyltransferase
MSPLTDWGRAGEHDLVSLLEQDHVDHSPATRRAFDLIASRYDIRNGHHPPPEAVASAMGADPLLLSSLRRLINIDIGFESFLKRLRRFLLISHARASAIPVASQPLIEAVAEQCFNNEYVMTEEDEEKTIVAALEQRLRSETSPSLQEAIAALFLLGMYRPIADLALARSIADVPVATIPEPVRGGVRRLVLEPLEEARLAASMPSFGGAASRTSQRVRAQYERHPYPRWFGLPTPDEDEVNLSPREILVAGSGTGRHPLGIALRNPRSRVLAVDLSAPSLAYAQRMAMSLGIDNVTFLRGDLLELAELQKQFDHIECSGVLHHLHDPEAGWSVLSAALRPGGTLHISIYSQVARMHVEALRREIADRGIRPAAEDIRRFRHGLLTDDKYRALRPYLAHADCFTLSGFRDYLFHERETRYTLAEIADCIARHGLVLLRFDPLALRSAYLDSYPEDHGMTSFENWRRFEPRYAGTNLMFSFLLRKAASR